MGNSKQANKKAQQKSRNKLLVLGGIIILLILGFVSTLDFGKKSNDEVASGDITIIKSEITETAKFYPYNVGNINMEVLAVKASDGTIRTAFNTCQVCYDSGRGYYVQEGDELVCQNCGNRFQLDQIEIIKGGCNPVPILEEDKTDDGTNIVILQAFLEGNKDLFGNWSK